MRVINRPFALASTLLLALLFMGIAARVGAEVVVIGGSEGLTWRSGGGQLQATVIRSGNTVENTNAPGGVIDFDPADRPNWIVPQRADTTRNIALGIDTPLRGGGINTPNNVSIRSTLGNLIDNDGNTALDLRASINARSGVERAIRARAPSPKSFM